jgi:amino-acid N-acetyltransferase
MGYTVRRARTSDVRSIARLVAGYADDRIVLGKETVTYYEDVQEFRVAEDEDGAIIGCGALHVMWEDLAEVRTLAVDKTRHGTGIGSRILEVLMQQAAELGVRRVFCLTFEVGFFARHGFHEMAGMPVDPDVYVELLRSADEGVAEFLDLARVKPNTLGNTRMIKQIR